jgi:hypothetical protein
MFGMMGTIGITLPQNFDPQGIFMLVMQILGLTWQRIRVLIVQSLRRRFGERAEQIMTRMETGVQLIRDLITRGPIALWERVQNAIGNIKDMIKNAVIEWLRNTIVVRAVEWILSMINPVGALYQLARGIYSIITFFLENRERIMNLVNAILGSIGRIALGQLTSAAVFVERVMARGLTLLIAFLARLLRLDGIARRIQRVIERIRQPIDRAITRVVNFVVDRAARLVGRIRRGARNMRDRVANWWRIRRRFRTRSGKSHTLFFRGTGRSAQVMIASREQLLARYLRDFRIQPNDPRLQQLERASRIYNDIQTLIGSAGNTQRPDPVIDRRIRDQFIVLSGLLAVLDDGSSRIQQCHLRFNAPKPEYTSEQETEYLNQLQGQENGINRMSIKQWLCNRDEFIARGGRSSSSRRHQRRFARFTRRQLLEQYRNQGIPTDIANQRVNEYMAGKAALHDPDQVGGGEITALTRMGDFNINSSIGRQWQDNIGQLNTHVRNYTYNIPESEKENVKMNVRITAG